MVDCNHCDTGSTKVDVLLLNQSELNRQRVIKNATTSYTISSDQNDYKDKSDACNKVFVPTERLFVPTEHVIRSFVPTERLFVPT